MHCYLFDFSVFDFDFMNPFLLLFPRFSLFLLGKQKKYQKETENREQKKKENVLFFLKKTHVFYICFLTLSKNKYKKRKKTPKTIKRKTEICKSSLSAQ
jgi:hypothetical protein